MASTLRVVLIAATAAIGGFLFGFDTAVINGAVGALQKQFHASELAIGLTGSAAAATWLGLPAWRWMFWTELAPAFLYGVGAFFIPESPRFLVARGRDHDALAVLRLVEGAQAEAKRDEIRHTVTTEYVPVLR